MPGPPPKENPIRRNAREVPWTDLPKAGRKGRAPALPKQITLRSAGKAWWSAAWKTPESTQWGDSELQLAARRAELEDVWQERGDLKVLPEMRHLETMLCMTPKARKEARWRIVDGDEPAEKAKPKKKAAKPKLRLVDPQAS